MAFLVTAGVRSGCRVGRGALCRSAYRSTARAQRRGVRMMAEPDMTDPDTRKIGFVTFSEKLNGRIAMIAFVAIVLIELLDPSHPTISEIVGRFF
mmetsp:Transcript_12860/g.39559  ORF Transcript_12860/g.39559 Transcript_12860/m.39559 type:complete len:95 (-) Transcript_12860:28-312(-)